MLLFEKIVNFVSKVQVESWLLVKGIIDQLVCKMV